MLGQRVTPRAKIGWLVLLAIIAVALALRLFHLGAQSLWYDEGYSVYLAGKSLAQITVETASDIQPPLYYYLLHIWMAMFGSSEFAVRCLSVLFGVLSVPLFYLLGRRLFSSSVGLLAAGLAALSPLYIWYSQEVRMYTLLVALTLCASYLLWTALEDMDPGSRRRRLAGAAAAIVLALYTHYFAVFILAFLVVYTAIAWLMKWHHFRLAEGLFALAAIVVAYLPWLPAMFSRYETDVSYWEGRLKLDEAVRKIGIVFSAGESVVESTGQWLALGFAVVVVVGLAALVLLRSNRSEREVPAHPWARLVFLLLYLLLPVALLLLTTYWTPKFNPRYAMIASPPLFILIAGGFVALWRSRRSWARGVALIMAVFTGAVMVYGDYGLYFDVRFTKPDFRGAAQWVETHRTWNEAVILTSGHAYPVFGYYYDSGDWYPLPEERTLSTADTLDYGVAQDLNRILDGKRGVWLVLWQDDVVDPNGYLSMLLDQYAESQPVEGSFYHVRLRHYILPPGLHFPETAEIAHPMAVNLGNVLDLLGYSPSVTQTVNLYWRAPQPTADDYKISLRMKDPTGFNWTRPDNDRRLASLLYPTGRWKQDELVVGHYEIPALSGTPPGVYDLEAVVYAERASQPLDILDAQGAPMGKTVFLGPITLDRPVPASPQDVGVDGPPMSTWGDAIGLLGYRQDRFDAQAGDEVHLTLFWQALAPIPDEYELRLSWVQDGKRIGEKAYPLAGEHYATTAWQPGDVLRGQYSLDVPLDIEAGSRDIQAALVDRALPEPLNQWRPLTSVNIEQTDRVFEPPEMQITIDANFEDMISLLGADVPVSEIRPGDTLDIRLYWKGLDRMDSSYTVFLHLLDGAGRMAAQEDRVPANGNRPTTGWVPGEVIEDPYQLPVDPQIAPGDYVLETGVYDAGDPAFPRLSVLDSNTGQPADNRVVIATLTVRP